MEIGVLSLAASDSVRSRGRAREGETGPGTAISTKRAFIACRWRQVKPSKVDTVASLLVQEGLDANGCESGLQKAVRIGEKPAEPKVIAGYFRRRQRFDMMTVFPAANSLASRHTPQ